MHLQPQRLILMNSLHIMSQQINNDGNNSNSRCECRSDPTLSENANKSISQNQIKIKFLHESNIMQLFLRVSSPPCAQTLVLALCNTITNSCEKCIMRYGTTSHTLQLAIKASSLFWVQASWERRRDWRGSWRRKLRRERAWYKSELHCTKSQNMPDAA